MAGYPNRFDSSAKKTVALSDKPSFRNVALRYTEDFTKGEYAKGIDEAAANNRNLDGLHLNFADNNIRDAANKAKQDISAKRAEAADAEEVDTEVDLEPFTHEHLRREEERVIARLDSGQATCWPDRRSGEARCRHPRRLHPVP